MDLDITLIFQFIIILLALIIAANICMKPFIRAMLERESRIEGAKGQAANLEQESRKLVNEYQTIIASKKQELATERSAQVVKTRGELQALQHQIQEQHAKELAASRMAMDDFELRTKAKLDATAHELSTSLVGAILAKDK